MKFHDALSYMSNRIKLIAEARATELPEGIILDRKCILEEV